MTTPPDETLETRLRIAVCDCDWITATDLDCAQCGETTRPYRESVLHWDDRHFHEACLLLRTLRENLDAADTIAALRQQLAEAQGERDSYDGRLDHDDAVLIRICKKLGVPLDWHSEPFPAEQEVLTAIGDIRQQLAVAEADNPRNAGSYDRYDVDGVLCLPMGMSKVEVLAGYCRELSAAKDERTDEWLAAVDRADAAEARVSTLEQQLASSEQRVRDALQQISVVQERSQW